MCKWGTWEKVKVKIPADLSSTGKEKWKEVDIDKCIAPLIRALQEGGIVAMVKISERYIYKMIESW